MQNRRRAFKRDDRLPNNFESGARPRAIGGGRFAELIFPRTPPPPLPQPPPKTTRRELNNRERRAGHRAYYGRKKFSFPL